jgi:Uma2 family endonuclease
MSTAINPAFYSRQYTKPLHFPESDGKPMAETDKHRNQMIALLNALEEYYRPDSGIYVTGNILVHYCDEAGEWKFLAPDIIVVKGVEKKGRGSYVIADEGKAPDFIIELVSPSTKVEDLGNKRVIYAGWRVKEYFLFDPTGELFSGPLRGFRLEGNDYVPMMGARLHSEVLGLDLIVEQGRLRLYDPKTGERLPTHEESEAARRAAEAKALQEATARQAAEAKAAQEAAARQAAETELARLREELAKLRGPKS